MRKNGSRPGAENPEWTEEDFRRARPALEVLPKEVVAAIRRYRGQRGPQKTPTKELISLRVDRDVVAAYRATGPGWQAKANDAVAIEAENDGIVETVGPAGCLRDNVMHVNLDPLVPVTDTAMPRRSDQCTLANRGRETHV